MSYTLKGFLAAVLIVLIVGFIGPWLFSAPSNIAVLIGGGATPFVSIPAGK